MNIGTHMPDGERRKPIDIEVCRSKAMSIHMFATRLIHFMAIKHLQILVIDNVVNFLLLAKLI
jgi:hypothetical protein